MRDRLAPAKILKLALRMLARDWRAGELTVLAAALVLAVGSMGTVGFSADRVKSASRRRASPPGRRRDDQLGPSAARRVRAERPRAGSDASPVIRFNSMVQKPGRMRAGARERQGRGAGHRCAADRLADAEARRHPGERSPPRGEAGPTRGSRSA
jgi:hypothetical protein